MRINKYLALATGMSRRDADIAVQQGKVLVNGILPSLGQDVSDKDSVTYNGRTAIIAQGTTTIILHKPAGYVVSRDGQGSKTIYNLLPPDYHQLKPIGRLDKESSGLLLLTNDGQLAHQLTHPSFRKVKVYEIQLDTPLAPLHRQMIHDFGVKLADGPSKLRLERMTEGDDTTWRVRMQEGRNRQIRRTFASLGYAVKTLHRTHFGPYTLNNLAPGQIKKIT